MKSRTLAILSSLLIASSFAIALGGIHRTKLGDVHSLSLPSDVILDERVQPLISSNGKVGFVASVTSGSLISFSVSSGKIIGSISVGENVGILSLVEVGGRRLIAVPAANRPTDGSPASISVIDATDAKAMEPKSILILPSDCIITPATRAMLSSDGKFCFIASSFDEPSLLSFSVQTGQLISRLPVAGRPSEVAIHDHDGKLRIAVASGVSNSLLLAKADESGVLSVLGTFTPSGAQFEDHNNPAFSADGETLFIAAAGGDRLYAISGDTAAQISSVYVPSPLRINVNQTSDTTRIAVMRAGKPGSDARGGVSVFTTDGPRLNQLSSFDPPEGVQFSRSNNAALTSDGGTVFVGSSSGVLFAFNAESGEVESYNVVGSELRRIALSEKAKAVAAIRSAPSGDQVVLIKFDLDSDGGDPGAPIIDSLSPSVVEQGRLKNVRLTVVGRNLTQGSSVVANGVDYAANLVRNGGALEVRLPKALFDQPGALSILVKTAGGVASDARELPVIRPDTPLIDGIEPTEIAGPAQPFTVQVKGQHFRSSSAIFVGDQPLTTERVSDKKLRAMIPPEIAGKVATLNISVRDLALSDLLSPTDKQLLIFGPRISTLHPSVETVVAGDKRFLLRIVGVNFRPGAQVDLSLNGRTVTATQLQLNGRKMIKVRVGSNIFQDSGSMNVVVRNSDGAASDPAQLNIHGPEILKILPGQLLAGLTDIRVDLRGANFRKHARIYVGNESGAFRIDHKRVTFRNSRRIVITLTGELNTLLAAPGQLKFSVVNPNSADGVPSIDATINVVPPIISDAAVGPSEEEGFKRIVIQGENFRKGALVEFLVDSMVVRQQAPLRFRNNKLVLLVRKKKLDAMRLFELRVVNPGNVPSALVSPHE